MAQITKAARAAYGLTADLIPADIMKNISQGELFDRLEYSHSLVRKAQASVDPTIRRGYAALARAALTAQPRARTERQAADLIAKAAGLGNNGQADALRRQAQELYERHPVAPRREDAAAVAIAKAKAKGGDEVSMVAVFDEAGKLIGVCDAAKIQPVTGTAGRHAAPQAPQAAEPVSKAGRAPAGRAPVRR